MAWSDFDDDSALERDMLRRALPLAPTSGDGSSRAVVDLAADTVNVAVSVSDVIGATPQRCIDLLAIRPLLVAAAWKVLDLMVEQTLDAIGDLVAAGPAAGVSERAARRSDCERGVHPG